MNKSYFTRSNVNSETLQISEPGRSSFDLFHDHHTDLPLGQFIPVDVTPLMPKGVLSGNVNLDFALDTIQTPQIGPLRLDSHVIAVSARRINSDWRKLIEGRQQLIPQFNIGDLFARYATSLFDGWTFSDLLAEFEVSGMDVDLHRFLSAAASTYHTIATSSLPEFGYVKDRLMILSDRLYKRASLYDSGQGYSYSEFLTELHYVFEPLFGENSVLDNLKYPCFTFYGIQMQALRDLIGRQERPEVFRDFTWEELFTYSFDPDPSVFVVPEMQIRAVYSAWYDNLRNWHLEGRVNLPDPDDWASTSIFNSNQYTRVGRLEIFLCPRYRTFGNDAFTTIQTDAAWRHVFAPIFDNDDQVHSNSEGAVVDDKLNRIYELISDGVSRFFPKGIFSSRLTDDPDSFTVLRADLKLMQRSGMLQTYLAHDYYCPDTYAGQMYAHWRIEANDLVGVSSQYIGGSEVFISGEQKVNATGTDDTPAGSRTFVGGGSTGANVVYSSGGDFVYIVSFASLQPIVAYDAKDMHLCELSRTDLPFPEFANDTRIEVRTSDMLRGFENRNASFIGYVPRYLQYRTILDSVHGRFLRENRSFLWVRDSYTCNIINEVTGYKQLGIDAYSMHVILPVDAWLNKQIWDVLSYGKVTFDYACDFPLPAAIDFF